MLRRALAADSRLVVDGGNLEIGHGVRAIVSSRGARAAHSASWASAMLYGMVVDGDVGTFSWHSEITRDAAALPAAIQRVIAQFARKAAAAFGGERGESFRGPILVTPDCLGDLLVDPLCEMLGADSVRAGRSPLAGRLGEAIAAPAFTLREAGAGLSGYPLAPFDREGSPRRVRALIGGGRLTDFLYDSYEARRAGREGGCAQGAAGAPPFIGAACLEVAPGASAESALLAAERAVLVPRFSGTINPTSGDFSGVVKGGALIRGGEARPIRETLIAGNLYEALNNISLVGDTLQRVEGVRDFPMVRIEDVSITAG